MPLIQEIDYGTPRSKSEAMVTLTIDGQSVTVPEGTSRLRLAVMASHTRSELREAARTLSRAALAAGFQPGAAEPIAAAQDAGRESAARHEAPLPEAA